MRFGSFGYVSYASTSFSLSSITVLISIFIFLFTEFWKSHCIVISFLFYLIPIPLLCFHSATLISLLLLILLYPAHIFPFPIFPISLLGEYDDCVLASCPPSRPGITHPNPTCCLLIYTRQGSHTGRNRRRI